MPDTIIDLIRHGEPQGGSLYRGHMIDDPLSDKGWQQMWDAVANDKQWQHIVSSPMLRCCEFAKQLSAKTKIPFSIDENLKEVGFGSWEGLTREQVKKRNLTEYNKFYNDPVNNRAAGFEDLAVFISRVTYSFKNISEQYSNKHILIVTHAGVIRAILAFILQAPPGALYKIKIQNSGVSRINVTTGEIIFVNAVS